MSYELTQLIDHWVAQWNEPSPDERRRLIREVWTEDGYQLMVNPPVEIRETAEHYGVPAPGVEIRGHDAMFVRVTRAYEMFISGGRYVFERQGELVRHSGAAVAMNWVMRTVADGSVAGGGLEVFTFGPDGRIRADHQFVA